MHYIKYDILVNKENTIDKSYDEIIKKHLVSVGKLYNKDENKYTDNDILLEKVAAINLKSMLSRANKISKDITIIPDSGYRNYEYQENVLNYYVKKDGYENALKKVSLPGTSEHHTGLAIDIAIFNDGKYIDDITGKEEPIVFLHNNAYRYGFILRYPKGKESITGYKYEPWHFRFVGLELAKELYEKDITLEEYYELKK